MSTALVTQIMTRQVLVPQRFPHELNLVGVYLENSRVLMGEEEAEWADYGANVYQSSGISCDPTAGMTLWQVHGVG